MSSGISSIVSRILGGYCKIENKGIKDEENEETGDKRFWEICQMKQYSTKSYSTKIRGYEHCKARNSSR